MVMAEGIVETGPDRLVQQTEIYLLTAVRQALLLSFYLQGNERSVSDWFQRTQSYLHSRKVNLWGHSIDGLDKGTRDQIQQ